MTLTQNHHAALAAAVALGAFGLASSAAQAQVTVLAHNGTPARTVSWSDAPDTWDRANLEAGRRGGNYRMLHQSTVPGYGAVQCYTANGQSWYFVVEGYASAPEADRAAFAVAQANAPRGTSIALCANWHNQNRYSLQWGN